MDKVIWGPNWEELYSAASLKNAPATVTSTTYKKMYGQFENTFMMYLPRLCGALPEPRLCRHLPKWRCYKRGRDIVLIDRDHHRGWRRLCISGCPYKKSTLTGRAAV
ncbi:hypothetical protein KCP69_15940 [Salmonella enterica subsp. enterica]|nr:hypothetical protein KCP69_15940 [Salmonella enterica subsp. enterica]